MKSIPSNYWKRYQTRDYQETKEETHCRKFSPCSSDKAGGNPGTQWDQILFKVQGISNEIDPLFIPLNQKVTPDCHRVKHFIC